MKKVTLLCTLLIILTSCTTKNQNKIATVKGEILSGNIEQVEFDWIKENPINDRGTLYTAKTDSNSNFKIEIPVEKLATGRITAGEYYHDICLMPGDNITVRIDGDSIVYTGKGAEKNSFLYALEKKGLMDGSASRKSYRQDFTLMSYPNFVKKFDSSRVAFLNNYPEKDKLENAFKEYFFINNQVICESLMQNFPRLYSYKHKIRPDSLQLSAEYVKMNRISSIMDDKKMASPSYLDNISTAIYKQVTKIIKEEGLTNYDSLRYRIMLDSLTGKTKEYALAQYICNKFSFENQYDSLAMNDFNQLPKDEISAKEVEKAMNKFNEKQALIGQPLNEEFSQTVLLDTANKELSFGEMMAKYSGNVVYVDMWSLGCGPCRRAMPYSEKLKEKLSELPVKFVYISEDRYSDQVWKNIFEVTKTTENQYLFKNGFNSKIHLFMKIYWVPNYMIFDKKGHLIDYNADRPSEDEQGESPLESKLRALAGE